MALGREDADGGGSYGFPAQLPNESDGNKVTPEGKNPAKIKLSGKQEQMLSISPLQRLNVFAM